MKIQIQTIPNNEQRYSTVGDYWIDEDGTRQIRVSDLENDDYNFLIAIHEAIEQHFCLKKGIKEEDITNFDKHFEDMRIAFPDLVGEMEAGDHDNAPYNREHKLASMFEKWVADNIANSMDINPGVFWEEYNKKCNEL